MSKKTYNTGLTKENDEEIIPVTRLVPDETVFKSYKVKVKVPKLNLRASSTKDSVIIEVLTGGSVLTIVDERKTIDGDVWGSNADGGWVLLMHCERIVDIAGK